MRTITDVLLAKAYYPILLECAKDKKTIFYGDLVSEAKKTYPNLEYVQNAIPVSVGRRLFVVREFTDSKQLPDITSIAFNKSEGRPGDVYTKAYDADKALLEVFEFSWADVTEDFNLHIDLIEKESRPKKSISREDAKKRNSEYYLEHKKSLPVNISDYREDIIRDIMDGIAPQEAFENAIEILQKQ